MGMTTFAASGNTGSKTGTGYPACIGDILSVGSVYDANIGAHACDATTGPDQVACLSQSDVSLDLLAPGAAITSTYKGGGLATFAGTSMASPAAAGVAALVLENEPSLPPAGIEARLTQTGTQRVDSGNGVATCRVDAYEAVINDGGPICGASAALGGMTEVMAPPPFTARGGQGLADASRTVLMALASGALMGGAASAGRMIRRSRGGVSAS
jgi:hypothetical protein